MRMNSNLKADVVGIKHHHDRQTNGRVVTPVLEIRIKEQEARAMLGEEFYRVVFGTLRSEVLEDDQGERITFGWISPLKPNVVVESHRVKLLGYEYQVSPEGLTVSCVDGERDVILTIKLPLPGDNEAFQGKLAMAYGATIDVGMNAVQATLPGIVGEPKHVKARKSGPWGNNRPVVVGGGEEPSREGDDSVESGA